MDFRTTCEYSKRLALICLLAAIVSLAVSQPVSAQSQTRSVLPSDGVPAALGYGVFTAVGAAILLGAVAKPHTIWDPPFF
jgi:hypothetical protein